ncbi:ABC transporter permease subunit [Streptomyces sp. SID5785]|uniref:carbohydrate ABC transporter permease n=1 Tax=Streptomyces sp. SID5785 TaxID=2690309 RepID=UPI001360D8D8|nr:carbohydrate ABC transporter permease [Streptomyces sp. SID5785]MZD08719.1 ABC transporter permease subunit [Streptomyces sp. SID5785]
MASETVTAVRRRAGKRGGLTLLAIALSLLSVFPILWMISSSLKSRSTVTDGRLLPQHVTWDNFRYVFTEVPFGRWLLNSFIMAAVITVAALFFHSMAAYALARLRFPGRDSVFAVIFSTLLITAPVILIPLFIIVRQFGMLDSYAGLIVPLIFNAFGIFLLRQFYLGIPRELEEAAIVDGCGYWRVYWNIVLPLSRPILSALAVFFFLANWNQFAWPLVSTSSADLTVTQVGIASFTTQYGANWNYILAAAVVAVIPMLALFLVFQRQMVESIKTSGLK